MRIQFIGACQEVTGSMHLVEAQGKRILLDCGMKQGKGPKGLKTPQNLSFQPEDIDCVIVSHAHVDHSGLLPWLIDRGFGGDIISTDATKELCNLLLLDSAKIMKEEYESGYSKEVPLYSEESVLETINRFKTLGYQIPLKIGEGIEVKLYDAGHVLGSAIVVMDVKGCGTICYTGDIGHGKSPILKPHAIPEEDINWLIIESTYGNKTHQDPEAGKRKLAEVINETVKNKKGKLLIPVFAVGRAQELLYDIKELMGQESIPRCKIYMDTPMGFSATELYRSFGYCLRKDFYELFLKGSSPFEIPELDFIKGYGRSMEVAKSQENCIVLAASGMLEGGRIVNYLPHVLKDKNSAILFVGYQAEGTLGRSVLEGENVELDGESVEVNCRVESLQSYSAHADYNNLINFVDSLKFVPHKIFVVHGEQEAAENLVRELRNRKLRAYAPLQLESFETAESRVVVDRIEEFKLGFKPLFENWFGTELCPVTGLLVNQGDGYVLLNKTQSHEFIGSLLEKENSELRRSVKELGIKKDKAVEPTESDNMSVEQLREELVKYRDLRLLTNRLIEEVYCEIMERGKNEAIRLLNLKRKKGRYNIEVRDDELKDRFHKFMVNIISSFDEEVVCRELKKLNPSNSCD